MENVCILLNLFIFIESQIALDEVYKSPLVKFNKERASYSEEPNASNSFPSPEIMSKKPA